MDDDNKAADRFAAATRLVAMFGRDEPAASAFSNALDMGLPPDEAAAFAIMAQMAKSLQSIETLLIERGA